MKSIAIAVFASMMVTGLGFSQPPQEPVNLGGAGEFVVLAASLISSIPTSAVVGNVGLSPAAGSEITGLTSGEVDGFIYTVDETGPAGSRAAAEMLTAAQGALTVAYNDAAGRTPVPEADFLNPGTGNIGGMTLESGLYKFTGTASITDSDVTLQGDENEVWIFQITTNLVVGNGIQVILAGGARAANVFWQVGTSATLGTASVFKGTILADQSVSLATGATVEGRLLARIAAVTLDAATITHPGDPTSITVVTPGIPAEFTLGANYPNPFNSSTQIEFTLPIELIVGIAVFDPLGRKVATLIDNQLSAGRYTVGWNATDFTSGIYSIRMEAGGFHTMRYAVLVR